MDRQRRGTSPNPALTPLSPPSPTSPMRPRRSSGPSGSAQEFTHSTLMNYTGVLRRPFEDSHQALCHQFNVEKMTITLQPGERIPQTINMRVLQDAHMPTHALLIFDSSKAAPDAGARVAQLLQTLVVPINADKFASKFSHDAARLSNELSVPGSPFPVPFWDPASRAQMVTLPAIPLFVPHPPSAPLLLLFGLGLHHSISPASPASPTTRRTRSPTISRFDRAPTAPTGALALFLLPVAVIEEFPSAAAMAEVMARQCADAELARYAAHNEGMWRNVLVLGPRDGALVEMVRTAWNVTKEARRIREHGRPAFVGRSV